jgi:hypothetical protein
MIVFILNIFSRLDASSPRLPAHPLLQHRVNIVHFVLRREHLLLQSPQLQGHERRKRTAAAAAASPARQSSRTFA